MGMLFDGSLAVRVMSRISEAFRASSKNIS